MMFPGASARLQAGRMFFRIGGTPKTSRLQQSRFILEKERQNRVVFSAFSSVFEALFSAFLLVLRILDCEGGVAPEMGQFSGFALGRA